MCICVFVMYDMSQYYWIKSEKNNPKIKTKMLCNEIYWINGTKEKNKQNEPFPHTFFYLSIYLSLSLSFLQNKPGTYLFSLSNLNIKKTFTNKCLNRHHHQQQMIIIKQIE